MLCNYGFEITHDASIGISLIFIMEEWFIFMISISSEHYMQAVYSCKKYQYLNEVVVVVVDDDEQLETYGAFPLSELASQTGQFINGME